MDSVEQQGYRSYVFPDLGEDLILINSGIYERKSLECSFHSNIFAINLVMRGKGFWQRDEGPRHPMGGGQSFIITPKHHYAFGPLPHHPWRELFLVVGGEQARLWQKNGLFPEEEKPRAIPHPNRIRNLYFELFSFDGSTSRFKAHRIRHLIEAILLERASQVENAPETIDPIVRTVRKACWARDDGQLDFEAMALQKGMSYSSLRQKFKEAMGLPPQKYLQQVRCRKAQYMLDDREISVSEVAEKLGFPDVYSFSRSFKRTTGLSPTEYRGR